MLTSSSQTTPAVPIGMKKAQENVSGAMGEAAGAHGPMVTEQPTKTTPLQKPKKKLPLTYIIAGIILLLVIIGGGTAYYLSTISQDIRQRATGCTYWTGGTATAGACDCRGNIVQQCLGGYWSTPGAGACAGMTCGGGVVASPSPSAAACAADLASCETLSCCGNSVCQGQAGSRVCQNPGTADQCPGGGTCTGYFSFQCGGLSPSSESQGVPVCQENPQFHGTDQAGAQARASATGCGQWDQVCVGGTNEGHLCGAFAIINQSCGGTGGNPSPSPSTNILSSPSPTPSTSPSPSPSPSPTPSASPSPTPTPAVGCNEACNISTDCANANHICYDYATDGNPDGGVCRLMNNPISEVCLEPTPSPTPSASPSPTPTPAAGCNDTCYRSSDCTFASAVCYDNLCRLDTNPTNSACQVASTPGTYYQQPTLPQALPQSGSEDILNWLKIGLGALGLGLIFLFL